MRLKLSAKLLLASNETLIERDIEVESQTHICFESLIYENKTKFIYGSHAGWVILPLNSNNTVCMKFRSFESFEFRNSIQN